MAFVLNKISKDLVWPWPTGKHALAQSGIDNLGIRSRIDQHVLLFGLGSFRAVMVLAGVFELEGRWLHE